MPEAPPPGIVRNGTPEATPGRWWDANNVRWRGGILQPIGGNVQLPATSVTDLPRDVITWHDNAYKRWAVFGTDTRLYAYDFSLQVLYDITPTGVGALDPPGALVGFGLGDYGAAAYGTARDPADIGPQDVSANMGDKWSLDTFGELLLVVPTQDGHLFVWDPNTPTVAAVVVTEAPTMNRGVIVTDQRQVVLLGAGGDPRNIAWSDQESLYIWTPDVTNLAGSKRLVTQAYALTALKVPQGILIFTTNDLHLMTYVGAPYAYGITQVAASCGPISHRAPIAIGSFAAWPSLQGFWSWAGAPAPFYCDVQDWFYSLVNRTMAGRVFGSPNPPFAELWWDWPDEGSSECNRYICVNYNPLASTAAAVYSAQRPWSIGMRSRTAGDLMGTMDYPILGGPAGAGGGLYLHEYGWLDNGNPRAPNGDIYCESGAIALGEGDKRFHVKQVVFDAATDLNNPAFGYRFFTREQPFSADADTGLYTVINDGLMDCRFSGRSVRMRLEATLDTTFAVGRPRLEVRPGGRR
jgi:hypothetical protein